MTVRYYEENLTQMKKKEDEDEDEGEMMWPLRLTGDICLK